MREVVQPCWATEVLCHVIVIHVVQVSSPFQNIIISFRPKTCIPSPKPQPLT